MKQFNLKDGTTLTIQGDTVTSNNEHFQSLANSILKGTFGRFDNSEVYPNKENAIAFFLAKELKLNHRI